MSINASRHVHSIAGVVIIVTFNDVAAKPVSLAPASVALVAESTINADSNAAAVATRALELEARVDDQFVERQ